MHVLFVMTQIYHQICEGKLSRLWDTWKTIPYKNFR